LSDCTPGDAVGALQPGLPLRGELISTDTVTTPGRPTLQHFNLNDLTAYTDEQALGSVNQPDFGLFYVGRDDAHGALMHLFTGSASA
jgi:hypothetical protein